MINNKLFHVSGKIKRINSKKRKEKYHIWLEIFTAVVTEKARGGNF
jgi:hypothetical protein